MERPLEWQIATVTAIQPETPRVSTFTLSLPHWTRHRAGQHYDVRLIAPDGYQAQRSYSVASEPERTWEIDLTVERLSDGEVSTAQAARRFIAPYMHDVLVTGDQIEVRGPIGGYFVWEAGQNGPLFLVAGGSGVVPLMAMLRHRTASGSRLPTRLLYSSRSPEDVIYANELEDLSTSNTGLEVVHTFTRAQPPDWSGYARRIDREMLSEVIEPLGTIAQAYISGPTLLVEAVANTLVEIGLPAPRIRTERFGPTGGNT